MKKRILALSFVLLFFAIGTSIASAATIQLTPSTGSYEAGDSFKMDVTVSSPDQPINAVSGILSFPKSKVQFVSISKTSSILSIWTQEPSYYDTGENGNISFEGVIPNPGFTGTRGRILSIIFKVKSTWQTELPFSSASVLANDGLGTNILTGQGGISIGIKEASPEKKKTPVISKVATKLERLIVSSDTHPDQDKWYSVKDAHFQWDNPKGILSVSTLFNTSSDSVPSTKSTLVVSEKEKKNIKDGINYFHVMYKTKEGWSRPAHYMVRVDTTSPKNLLVNDYLDSNRKHVLSLQATDELSGIDYFNITIPGYESSVAPAVGGRAIYDVNDVLSFGENTIKIEAVDFAGNKKETTADIVIDILEKPEIISYTKNIKINESIQINGRTKYPDFDTFIYVISPNGKVSKYLADVNEKGEFTAFTDKVVEEGKYSAWIKIYTNDGSKYAESAYVEIDAKFSLWNYILSSSVLIVSILFFIFSLAILILAVFLLRLHKSKVIGLKN